MLIQELPHARHEFFGSILEHVMPGIGDDVRFGLRKTVLKLFQKVERETPVPRAPEQQHRSIGELRQSLLNLDEPRVTRMTWPQWNVLHEAQHGDSVGPRIIRSQ